MISAALALLAALLADAVATAAATEAKPQHNWTGSLKTTSRATGRTGENRHLTLQLEGQLPTEALLYLKGARGEHRAFDASPRGTKTFQQWQDLVESVHHHGVQQPVLVVVEWTDDLSQAMRRALQGEELASPVEAFIYEGNHRVHAAQAAHKDTVPVQVRFFGHAERHLPKGTLSGERAREKTLQDMLPRAMKLGLVDWLEEAHEDYPQDLKAILASREYLLDELDQWLCRDLGINVENDGTVSFFVLDDQTRRLLGDLPIRLYHHTATGALQGIRQRGLMPAASTGLHLGHFYVLESEPVDEDEPTSYAVIDSALDDAVFWSSDEQEAEDHATELNEESYGPHSSGAGVYLTTEASGPAVESYRQHAVRRWGGEPASLMVRIDHISELSPDPDDADISSGKHQFIVPYVPASNVLF